MHRDLRDRFESLDQRIQSCRQKPGRNLAVEDEEKWHRNVQELEAYADDVRHRIGNQFGMETPQSVSQSEANIADAIAELEAQYGRHIEEFGEDEDVEDPPEPASIWSEPGEQVNPSSRGNPFAPPSTRRPNLGRLRARPQNSW